ACPCETTQMVSKGQGICAASFAAEASMKTQTSGSDRLIARYYPTVYSFASALTDDPREAIALTRGAFKRARKQAEKLRNPTAIALVLISAVIRAELAPT